MTRYEEAKAAGFPHRGLIFCHTCGGSYIEVGVSGGKEVPHADDCPRNPSKEWRPEEQDREAAALRDLRAPFPIDSTHEWDCPCNSCESDRRRALRRSGIYIPGLSPKGEETT